MYVCHGMKGAYDEEQKFIVKNNMKVLSVLASVGAVASQFSTGTGFPGAALISTDPSVAVGGARTITGTTANGASFGTSTVIGGTTDFNNGMTFSQPSSTTGFGGFPGVSSVGGFPPVGSAGGLYGGVRTGFPTVVGSGFGVYGGLPTTFGGSIGGLGVYGGLPTTFGGSFGGLGFGGLSGFPTTGLGSIGGLYGGNVIVGGMNYGASPVYGGRGGYYPSMGGGYYPPMGGGYYPPMGGSYYPPMGGGYYPPPMFPPRPPPPPPPMGPYPGYPGYVPNNPSGNYCDAEVKCRQKDYVCNPKTFRCEKP